MKKIIALSLAISSSAAMADPAPLTMTEAKQATAFTSLGILGTVAAGPVGLLIGAVSGAYLGEQIKKADSLQALELAKAETEHNLHEVSRELAARDIQLAQLEQSTLENLQLQILFMTGSDTVTRSGKQQVHALASFLVKNPHLQIHLTGHTDPRGTDDYNDVLSYQRALSIQHALEQVGIEPQRIRVSAQGSAYSTATRGNLDSYAFDRRVDIEILTPQKDSIAMSR
jgi:outer membrane protein OmpA-like peptidoglycan-associated protein